MNIMMSIASPAMQVGRKRKRTLAGDLSALLSSGAAADVIVKVDSVRLLAHRSVLAARSPVIAAMFRRDLQEACDVTVDMAGMSQEVVRQLLQFLYTDEAPLLECVAAGLLVAADKYNVPRLKQQCVQQLINDLCVENAAEGAILAMMHSCAKLKVAAINFIRAHSKKVMATDGWANAMRDHTEDTVKICRLLGEATHIKLECENETSEVTDDAEGSLEDDLLTLLDSGEGSDVTLVVDGVRIPAHKAVLAARSPVLVQELEGAPDGVLQVDRVRWEQLRGALNYIYGDLLPEPASVTEDLLVLADDYGLRRLKDYCESQLEDRISVENAMALAVVATKHSCSSLKRVCVDFIRMRIFEVMDTAGWDSAIRNDAETVIEISKCMADQYNGVTSVENPARFNYLMRIV